jgi:hypothetical protein
MKQCIALAMLVCLSATGCVSSGLFAPKCGDACQAGPSMRGSRQTLIGDGRRHGGPVFGKDGCYEGNGCAVAGCFGACNCNGCASGGPCQCMAEKVANGFCGACPVAHGMCPHAGGYPEQPMFQPGPPTGQVAYPYYTTRGPRDFLLSNPPSIGPQ